MKWTRKAAQIRTRNYPMALLQKWGGCDIIEWRWYNREKAHFVMDSLGDVYLYKPKCAPAVAPPKKRIGGNRGANDALPRVRARDGEMVKLFHAGLRPLGKPNEKNVETARDKKLEARLGHEIAARFGLTYKPNPDSDGTFVR